ncbi:MAG: histidine phosphatase family protein [Rothia sp. (in: high G+C Gram-positive bacteria)]|nr:histidine phosphatase family protein [Rothia sp. (in: high G+C Gram-positive bacteria)]
MTSSHSAPREEAVPPARVVLIRHGQTDWNLEHRFQGQADTPLNNTGRAQAQEAAENLRAFAQTQRATNPDFAWDAIVTSPLSRAHETGEIIARELGLEISGTYEGMQERSFGEAEGVQVTPDIWQNMDEHFAGIEPLEDLRARGIESLNVALREHAGQNLIVVAHGMWISQMITELTGEEMAIPVNASVTELPLELLTHHSHAKQNATS